MEITYVLLACVVVGLGSSLSVDDCPASALRDDSNLRVYGGMCYQFNTNRRRYYTDALFDCTSQGGTLVIIKNAELNFYISDTLQVLGSGEAWIGLSDEVTEGTYVWTDGTLAAYQYVCQFTPTVVDAVQSPVDGAGDTATLAPTQAPTTTIAAPTTTTATPTTTTEAPTTTTEAPQTTTSTKSPTPTTSRPTVVTLQSLLMAGGDSADQETPAPATTTTSAPATRAPASSTESASYMACPPFSCNLDCGMDGYLTDDNDCSICKCGDSTIIG